jgi:hypothetical protein
MSGSRLTWAGLSVIGLALLVVLGIVALRPDDRDQQPTTIAPTSTAPAAPADLPSLTPEPDRWRVVVADPAGGLALLREGSPELPVRQSGMADAGIEVIELVGGGYEVSSETPSVEFYGGTLAEPLTGQELADSASTLLQTTFRVNFPNLTPVDEQIRAYDAGPLGGQLGCTTYDGDYYACGWLDEQTIGYVFVIGGTEAGTAELLLSLRADTELR